MKEQVYALIHTHKLTRIADDIISLLRPAIHMQTQPVADEAALAPGTSKIGGFPDLLPESPWPAWNDKPLPFLAQIRLDDIAPYDPAHQLPHTGLLSFFFNDEALEAYPPARASWHVLYYDGDFSRLQRRSLPGKEQLVCAMTFAPILTLPPFESLFLQQLGLSYDAFKQDAPVEQRQEADAYMELGTQLDALYNHTPLHHQLLGHPDQIQGDLLLECQHDTQYEGDPTDWQLLLQVDSDDDAGLMWGDVGMLYFYIPQKALAAQDFSQVHVIMQCS